MKKITIFFLILCFLHGCTFSDNVVSLKTDEIILSEDVRNPPVYYALLENNDLIYYVIENDSVVFYVHNLLTNTSHKLNPLQNHYLDTGKAIIIDDKIYFYITESLNGQIKNFLYCLTTNTYELSKIPYTDDSLAGLQIFYTPEGPITLKNIRTNDKILTFLDKYNISNDNWSQFLEQKYVESSSSGSALYVMYADTKYIYVLLDEYDSNGNCSNYLLQLDHNMKTCNKILINGELKQFINSGNGRILELNIWNNEYIYLKNLSSEGFLGNIKKDNTISTINIDNEFLCASSIYPTSSPLFYKRGGNTIYTLDKKRSTLEPYTLNCNSSQSILQLWTANNTIAVVFSDDTHIHKQALIDWPYN